jgi:membrane protease YdiL (CAAX protease family)
LQYYPKTITVLTNSIYPLQRKLTTAEILLQFVSFCAIALGLYFIGSILALLIAIIPLGLQMKDLANLDYEHLGNKVVTALKIMNAVSMIIAFGASAFIIPKVTFRAEPFKFLRIHKSTKLKLVFLVVAVFVSTLPLMDLINNLNHAIVLPQAFESVETWIKNKEDYATQLTIALIKVNQPIDIWVNLIVIALIPAICEELFFRGLLQKSIFNWTGKIHLSILLTSIIFSAIHFQFYGFFPRMLLGMMFGYFVYWSGDLKLSMIAHFINNAFAFLGAYMIQMSSGNVKLDDQKEYPIYIYFISAITTALFTWMFYKNGPTLQMNEFNKEELIPNDSSADSNFKVVYTSALKHDAEIMAGMLIDGGFDPILLNKIDSAYPSIGFIEVHVPDFQEEAAKNYLKTHLE